MSFLLNLTLALALVVTLAHVVSATCFGFYSGHLKTPVLAVVKVTLHVMHL